MSALVHGIVASRQSAALAIERGCWPVGTTLRGDDVLLDGASLADAARAGTPAVRIAEAANTRRRQRFVTLVLATVLEVRCVTAHGRPQVTTDADLGRVEPCYEDVRVVGRRTASHRQRMQLLTGGAAGGAGVRLPRDIAPGDALVIPVEGTVALCEVRRRGHAEERPPEEPSWDVPRCPRHVVSE